MHKIFLISGIVVTILAIIVFSQFLKDAGENPEIEIKTAPIHEVEIMIAESYPEQVIVYIKGGLPDGCAEFNDLVTEINGDAVNITVTIKRPKDAVCPAIYGYFEKNVNIGSNFLRGQDYTVNVNGFTAQFTYPQ
jgi:inhibitor of cysteine peptidase